MLPHNNWQDNIERKANLFWTDTKFIHEATMSASLGGFTLAEGSSPSVWKASMSETI